MSHPIQLVKDLIGNFPKEMRSGLRLKIVAYPRKGKVFPDVVIENPFYGGRLGETRYEVLNWRESVIGVPDPQTLEYQVQVAVFKLVATAATHHIKLEDLEWGISTDMGSHFIPAADLQSGLDWKLMHDSRVRYDIEQRFLDLERKVQEDQSCLIESHVTFYYTGHGFHAYMGHLMPIHLRTKWLRGLESLGSVDKKWAAIAQMKRATDDDQAVLRWSAGDDGRCIPVKFEVQE